jgi:hypothetical protein
MGSAATLAYLLTSWAATTAVLIILVIYGNTLSIREDDELYLNKAESQMMASEQRALITKINQLNHVIIILAALSTILLLASGSVWAWIGLHRS